MTSIREARALTDAEVDQMLPRPESTKTVGVKTRRKMPRQALGRPLPARDPERQALIDQLYADTGIPD